MTVQDTSGVVVPPPVVCLIAVLAGLGLERRLPLAFLPQGLRYSLGPALDLTARRATDREDASP